MVEYLKYDEEWMGVLDVDPIFDEGVMIYFFSFLCALSLDFSDYNDYNNYKYNIFDD